MNKPLDPTQEMTDKSQVCAQTSNQGRAGQAVRVNESRLKAAENR
jgi:hypothetical protein